MLEKSEICLLQICQGPEPFCLVFPVKTEPPVKHGVGDPETCAEFLYSPQMKEVFANDTQNEEEAVGTIGDQRIGQEGMGTPAAPTPNPGDPDRLAGGMTIEKIKDITLIAGEADTASPAPAVRTCLQFRPEPILLALIEVGC